MAGSQIGFSYTNEQDKHLKYQELFEQIQENLIIHSSNYYDF